MIFPEHTTNFVKGKGFNSNDKVLYNFIHGYYDKDWSDDVGTEGANWNNAALKYFGFKGTYDANIKGVGEFDPKDGSVKFRALAFRNYDCLRAVYEEELFHSKDYLNAEKNAPYDKLSHEYEEWRAQIHQNKNKGLYSQSGFNWTERIYDWGRNAGIYDLNT